MSESTCVSFDDARGGFLTLTESVVRQPNAAAVAPIKVDRKSPESNENMALKEECRAQEKANFISASPADIAEGESNVVNAAAAILVQSVQDKLDQDAEELLEDGEQAPSENAINTCIDLAKFFAPHLALVSDLKWGAFTEDSGGISLVFQSLVADRRLNCRISTDGKSISALQINEDMKPATSNISLGDKDKCRGLAEWVTSRD